MENYVREKVNIPKWILYFAFLVLGVVIFSYFYIFTDAEDAKLLSILSGLLSGLVLYILSFITGVFSIRQIDKFRNMRVRNLLKNRHDKSYYKPLFANARNHVEVTGASCTRLITDFLDQDSDDKVLIDAMQARPKLQIRILIPADGYMTATSKASWRAIEPKVTKLKVDFEDQIQFRRFNHPASHSFVRVDGDLIAGPIFQGQDSKHSPAVHVDMKTPFAEKHLNYFNDLWEAEKTK